MHPARRARRASDPALRLSAARCRSPGRRVRAHAWTTPAGALRSRAAGGGADRGRGIERSAAGAPQARDRRARSAAPACAPGPRAGALGRGLLPASTRRCPDRRAADPAAAAPGPRRRAGRGRAAHPGGARAGPGDPGPGAGPARGDGPATGASGRGRPDRPARGSRSVRRASAGARRQGPGRALPGARSAPGQPRRGRRWRRDRRSTPISSVRSRRSPWRWAAFDPSCSRGSRAAARPRSISVWSRP